METLYKQLTLMFGKHFSVYSSTGKVIAALRFMCTIEKDKNPSMCKALSAVTAQMENIEQGRKAMVDRCQAQMLVRIYDYIKKCETERKTIDMRDAQEIKLERAKGEIEKMQNEIQKNSARISLEADAKKLIDLNKSVAESVVRLETSKIEDIKGAMRNFLHSQIEFYAGCLEKLTVAFREVDTIDAAADTAKLKILMKFETAPEQAGNNPNNPNYNIIPGGGLGREAASRRDQRGGGGYDEGERERGSRRDRGDDRGSSRERSSRRYDAEPAAPVPDDRGSGGGPPPHLPPRSRREEERGGRSSSRDRGADRGGDRDAYDDGGGDRRRGGSRSRRGDDRGDDWDHPPQDAVRSGRGGDGYSSSRGRRDEDTDDRRMGGTRSQSGDRGGGSRSQSRR